MGTTLRVVGKTGDVKDVADNAQVSDAELQKAEDDLRREARSLIREIEHKYWDLGRVLYDVYDGVPGGYRALLKGKGSAGERRQLFEKWGYKSYAEWVEQEVGLRKRTAENLRYAYWWFEIQQELPKDVIEKIIPLGRSKVYLLAGVADAKNITLWIDKAENQTFEQLKQSINEHKEVLAQKQEEAAARQGFTSEEASTPKKERDAKPLPKPEEMFTFQAGLFPAQKATFDAAFKRAQNITKSEKKGHNLELICQDFLSNNDFDNPEKDLDGYLSKVARRLGVLIIAIDPKSGKPVHGRDLLWKMIEEAKEADK